jgi:hypothetical protein
MDVLALVPCSRARGSLCRPCGLLPRRSHARASAWRLYRPHATRSLPPPRARRRCSPMPPNTLAPVSDVWRVAMAAGAGAVPLCAVWVEGRVDACGTTRRWRSIYGTLICARCHPPADVALVAGWEDA